MTFTCKDGGVVIVRLTPEEAEAVSRTEETSLAFRRKVVRAWHQHNGTRGSARALLIDATVASEYVERRYQITA